MPKEQPLFTTTAEAHDFFNSDRSKLEIDLSEIEDEKTPVMDELLTPIETEPSAQRTKSPVHDRF